MDEVLGDRAIRVRGLSKADGEGGLCRAVGERIFDSLELEEIMLRNFMISAMCVAFLLAVSSVEAQIGVERNDNFAIQLGLGDGTPSGPYNEPLQGGGSGYNGGEWIEYPNPPGGGNGWWNQWFYNDPPDSNRWKEITYDLNVDTAGSTFFDVGTVEIALNWSTMAFPETGEGGPPPLDEQFIERYVIGTVDIFDGMPPENFSDTYVISTHNPEWVSIDIRVISEMTSSSGIAAMQGTIVHQCVPEPLSMTILAVGGFLLLTRRRCRACQMPA